MLLRYVILVLTVFVYYLNAEVLVTIPNGKIRGRKEYSLRNISFYAFQEIPFGKPPVGNLRFQEPEPAESWEGVLDATKNTKICYQQKISDEELAAMQNEDCLYLNVYTPTYPTSENSLPVMFYIYGGGFVTGAANFNLFGPHYLMEHDVVVVTANYRVGPFGFLSTGDLIIPGNYGLKDQLLALKWVNQNIKYFGGDPEKVTIFGQSAGGASVNFHLMSKKSEGLFRAAISQSASFLCPWVYQKDFKAMAYDLASHLDAKFDKNSSSQELLTFLRNAPAGDLSNAAASFPEKLMNDQIIQGFLFTPTVEPEHEAAFITEMMYEAVEKGHINPVPMLIGICSEELITFASNLRDFAWGAMTLDSNASLLVNNNMHLTDANQRQAAGDAIHRIYTDGAFVDNLGKAVQFYSDTSFSRGVIRYAELQSKFSDIYFYQFSYYGPLIGDRPNLEGAYRVGHSDDNIFLWAYGNNSNMNEQVPSDILTSDRYIQLFTNFAKYLNPTPGESIILGDITWPTVDPDNFQYLDINDTLTVKKNPKSDVYPKWVELYEEMAIKPYTTF